MEELKKKYNLFTGIALVVGIAIGSGIFIKAHTVLINTNGNLLLSLLAWLIGGVIMVISAYVFSLIASRVVKNNGAVDYFETATSKKAGYYLGWYFATMYYPILVAIVSFVTSGFFLRLCGITATIEMKVLLGIAFIIGSFLLNTLSPKIAGYFQMSSTFIKLIPIIVISLVGLFIGLNRGTFTEAFAPLDSSLTGDIVINNSFGRALISTTFSYEGWIIATSINAEMKDSKKNLPRALVIGSTIVVVCYLLYNLGLSLIIGNSGNVIASGEDAPVVASKMLFGNAGPYIFYILLIVSCLGTLNGLVMACSRGMYSLAVRDEGICPDKIKKLHPKFNISIGSSIIGLGLSFFFMLIWYLALKGYLPFTSIDELSVALVYFSYIFVYIYIIKTYKDLNVFNRFIMPILAIICALFVIISSMGILDIFLNKSFVMMIDFFYFVAMIFVFMLIAFFVKRKNERKR